jgi:peptide/nickel transport system ATP-binding protein
MLLPPRRARIGGRIRFAGEDVLAMSERRLADHRGRSVAMIFQEPMLAFDPVFTIGAQIAETVRRHEGLDHAAARRRALEMLERVRIPGAARRLDAYPHEMSGGMRQRAMIALALSCRPKLLLADEPTTALDATVQIQILLLLRELQAEFGMAVIFVTHDIGVAVETSDRIAVMYAGRIVESGARLGAIPGAPPDLARIPTGCAFAPRCAIAQPACGEAVPAARDLGGDHRASCLRAEMVATTA